MRQFLKWAVIVLLLVITIGLVFSAIRFTELNSWIKLLFCIVAVISGFFAAVLWSVWKDDGNN